MLTSLAQMPGHPLCAHTVLTSCSVIKQIARIRASIERVLEAVTLQMTFRSTRHLTVH